jgi:hypothetical protein
MLHVLRYVKYTRPLSAQAQYSRSCQNLRYNSNLDARTVVRLTAAKFKPLMFSMSDFALPNMADICIFMILCNLCLLPASFYNIIVDVRNIESLMQFSDWCAPRKVANGAENLVAQVLQFQQMCGYLPQIPRWGKHKSLWTE